MAVQRILKPAESNGHFQNKEISPILIAMGEEFGYVAAHHIFSYLSRTTMKSITEILFSDYDTFSRILKQVYTEEVAEKEILSRLSRFRLKERIG
ncbi:MAG: hypothetical protein ACE5R3_00770 [Nitrosopumilaceae archaeon]